MVDKDQQESATPSDPDGVESLRQSVKSLDVSEDIPASTNDGDSMRRKAYGLCRDYLHGAWQLIDAKQMVFKPITGGLSNLLFLCELPRCQAPLGDEPSQVLLRMYGQVRDGAHESTITESVIFTLLAERKLGPKLYGIFPGGRLEEYIQAKPLTCSNLREPQISQVIAEKMAAVHTLDIPISKEPTFLWTTMKDWIQLSRKCLSDSTLSAHPDKAEVIKALRQLDYEQEMEWVRTYLSRSLSPVLFCHNDCQEGNILRHGDAGEHADRPARLTLIDYEYCSYNYRGFDLANHFCEWMYDYSPSEYPFFRNRSDHWPDRQQQLRYVRSYLRTRDAARRSSGRSGDAGEAAAQQEEEQILQEVRSFTLASHLFWTLWSIVNAPVSTIPFGYWEYGLCRMEAYRQHKQRLLDTDSSKHPSKPPQGVKRASSELE